jgi:hypothetical protein
VSEDRSHRASLAGKGNPQQFLDRAVSTVAGHQVTGANMEIRAGRPVVHGGSDPVVLRVQRGELMAATHRDVVVASRTLVSGADADLLHPQAVAAANHTFAFLRTGLASSLS